jgi:hypothetical protein
MDLARLDRHVGVAERAAVAEGLREALDLETGACVRWHWRAAEGPAGSRERRAV